MSGHICLCSFVKHGQISYTVVPTSSSFVTFDWECLDKQGLRKPMSALRNEVVIKTYTKSRSISLLTKSVPCFTFTPTSRIALGSNCCGTQWTRKQLIPNVKEMSKEIHNERKLVKFTAGNLAENSLLRRMRYSFVTIVSFLSSYPRPAGIFGRTRLAGGGADSTPPV